MSGDPAIAAWFGQYADQVALSSLTFAEISRGIQVLPDSKAKRQLDRAFHFLMEDFSGAVWVFDEAAGIEWGRLMAEAQARNRPLPFADSYISAIARTMGARVATADNKGFVGCARVDPWTGIEHDAWT